MTATATGSSPARWRCAARARCPATGSARSTFSAAGDSVGTGRPTARAKKARKRRASASDVVGPLAQRRHADLDDVQAKQQVLAEPPACTSASRLRLVAATTRTSALRVRVSPTRSNCFSCRKRSSFACRRQGQVADLVEEQRAALGRLDAPGLVADRAGERALAWPNSSLASSSSVSVGQLTVTNGRSRRLLWSVDRAGEHALAGAVLAAQQHRRIGLRRACRRSRARRASPARCDSRSMSGRLRLAAGSRDRPGARSASAALDLVDQMADLAGVNGLGR